MDSKQLTRYVVLNVEPVLTTVRPSAKVGKVRGSKAGSVSRGRGQCTVSSTLLLLVIGGCAGVVGGRLKFPVLAHCHVHICAYP